MTLHSIASLTPDAVKQTAASLERGGLACLPTDTVYGLACAAGNPRAVDELFRAKGREEGKPVAMVFGDVASALDLLPEAPAEIRTAIEALLPGPVTVIVPALAGEAGRLSGILGSPGALGMRVIPPPLDTIYRQLPSPLALTSANLSGQPDPCSLDEVAPEVLAACDFAVDAGRCVRASSSTVVDLRPLAAGEPAVILRKGAAGVREIEKILGRLDERTS